MDSKIKKELLNVFNKQKLKHYQLSSKIQNTVQFARNFLHDLDLLEGLLKYLKKYDTYCEPFRISFLKINIFMYLVFKTEKSNDLRRKLRFKLYKI